MQYRAINHDHPPFRSGVHLEWNTKLQLLSSPLPTTLPLDELLSTGQEELELKETSTKYIEHPPTIKYPLHLKKVRQFKQKINIHKPSRKIQTK